MPDICGDAPWIAIAKGQAVSLGLGTLKSGIVVERIKAAATITNKLHIASQDTCCCRRGTTALLLAASLIVEVCATSRSDPFPNAIEVEAHIGDMLLEYHINVRICDVCCTHAGSVLHLAKQAASVCAPCNMAELPP